MGIELLLPVVLKWNLWVAVVLLGGNMAVENSKVGPIEEIAQSWQDEIEGRVKGLQTGSYARILKMAKKPSKQEFRRRNPFEAPSHGLQSRLAKTAQSLQSDLPWSSQPPCYHLEAPRRPTDSI
jgi:hypothetical protein